MSFDKLLAEIFAFKVKLSNTFATTVERDVAAPGGGSDGECGLL